MESPVSVILSLLTSLEQKASFTGDTGNRRQFFKSCLQQNRKKKEMVVKEQLFTAVIMYIITEINSFHEHNLERNSKQIKIMVCLFGNKRIVIVAKLQC